MHAPPALLYGMIGTLSVSGRDVSCDKVLQVMRELQLCGDVTTNMTLAPDGTLEPGCRIIVSSQPPKAKCAELYNELERRFALGCGHLKVEHSENGCVKDMFRPSLCPSNIKEAAAVAQ